MDKRIHFFWLQSSGTGRTDPYLDTNLEEE